MERGCCPNDWGASPPAASGSPWGRGPSAPRPWRLPPPCGATAPPPPCVRSSAVQRPAPRRTGKAVREGGISRRGRASGGSLAALAGIGPPPKGGGPTSCPADRKPGWSLSLLPFHRVRWAEATPPPPKMYGPGWGPRPHRPTRGTQGPPLPGLFGGLGRQNIAVCAPGRGAARPSLPPSAAPPALFAHFASCRARALWARPLVRSGAARPPAVRPLRPGPPRSLARPLCAAARLRGLSLAPAGSWVVLRSAAGSPFGVALAPLRAPQSPARGPAGPPRALRPSGFGGSPPRFARRRAGSRPGGPARPFGPLVGASGPPGLWLRARACAGLLQASKRRLVLVYRGA